MKEKLNTKRVTSRIYLFLVGLFIAVALSLASCDLRMSADELATEVQQSMVETWKEQGFTPKVTKGLRLTHKGGNEYVGLITLSVDGESEQFSVNVTYDGNNVQWEVVE
jgi:hypothetical protein